MVNFNQPEGDGVDDLVEQQVRVGMSMLGQLGTVVTRGCELAERRQEQADRAAAEESRERFSAEREAAHAILNGTRAQGWWEQASPQEVGRTYAVADAWACSGDPLASWSRENLEAGIQARYGLSPEALQAMVNETERERDRDRADADRSERTASSDRVEASTPPEPEQTPRRVPPWEDDLEPEAAPAERPGRPERKQDLAAANLVDGAEDARRDHAYDSAERREAFAERMRSEGVDGQMVADRLRSDMSQGKPASAAVKASAAAKARKGRSYGPTQARQASRGR